MSPTIVLDHGIAVLALGSPVWTRRSSSDGAAKFPPSTVWNDEHNDPPPTPPHRIPGCDWSASRTSQRNTTLTSAEPAFIASPLATLLLARGTKQFVNVAAEIGGCDRD
jgi:hypothetical protein